MENFAQRIRQLRKESGKTQTQMAAVFEISARQYQNYEGGGHYPDVPGLMKMADYFGVTTDYLLGRSDQLLPQGGWSSGDAPPISLLSCQKRNGPCTVQREKCWRAPVQRPSARRGSADRCKRRFGPAFGHAILFCDFSNCCPVADGAEGVGVVVALRCFSFR